MAEDLLLQVKNHLFAATGKNAFICPIDDPPRIARFPAFGVRDVVEDDGGGVSESLENHRFAVTCYVTHHNDHEKAMLEVRAMIEAARAAMVAAKLDGFQLLRWKRSLDAVPGELDDRNKKHVCVKVAFFDVKRHVTKI